MNAPTIIVVLDQACVALASRIRAVLPHAEVHGLSGRVTKGADRTFDRTVDHVVDQFEQGHALIGICASGILIRALSTSLTKKREEPPVLSVSADGASVVPLLGGHRGANQLAGTIAGALNAHAAITTAGDVSLGIALDVPPAGWFVQNPDMAKPVVAALIAGDQVALTVEAGAANWLDAATVSFVDEAELTIRVTDQVVETEGSSLVLNPPSLVLGVGCERHTESRELISLVEETLQAAGLTPRSVACVASIDLKSDEGAVHDLGDHLGVPVRFFDPKTLEAETPRLVTPSDIVFHETGCHGVAEGAALAAVGEAGQLIVPKNKSQRATCAIARADGNVDALSLGKQQGVLSVVGIGPGAAEWRTPEVTRALSMADDVVGYGLYLDLVGKVIAGKARHESDLAEEEARARRALELAAEGRRVALVCSGDAGIYALACLVFELLDREDNAAWNQVDIAVCPGVSAIQAAAARIGAPIGHDFCTVSLSDLLTPWPMIEQRLKAAALGDFVVALYNPVSRKRQNHIVSARRILMEHRPVDTPVVLARNLGREGEQVTVIRLKDLGPDKADMLTLVLIGNSQSRFIERGEGQWVYTPRGYARKMAPLNATGQGDAA